MAGDKPFEATPSRIARARREGDVPRSSDLVAVISTASGALATCAFAPTLARAALIAFEAATLGRFAAGAYASIALVAACVACAALAGAIVATFAQTRRFAFSMPSPRFSKLSPVAGLKKMLSRDAAFAALKASGLGALLACALAPVVRASAGGDGASAVASAARAERAIASSFAIAIGASALFAIADVAIERAKWRRRLRMSFDEVRRDARESDGDPHLKSRRKATARARSRGSIGRLKDAAVVVVNPTHVAIALEYAPPAIPVPRVAIRAIDEGALEVKRRARELGIPIVEDRTLARALLAVEIDKPIPPSAYLAVAAIVASLARSLRTTSS